MDDWTLIRRYQRLAERGRAKELACDFCDNPYITRLGPDDNPVLQCWWCNTRTTPGLALMRRIEAVVNEHYVDS